MVVADVEDDLRVEMERRLAETTREIEQRATAATIEAQEEADYVRALLDEANEKLSALAADAAKNAENARALSDDEKTQARSVSHWSPYDRVRVVNAVS